MMRYRVRRTDKEIVDEAVMRKILKSTQFVSLAMCKDNRPYLVSVSHGYDEADNCIYFHCAMEGKKLNYLKSNNVVWGQALLDHGYAEGSCNHLYASVHFLGRVTMINNETEKRRALECMMRQLDSNPEKQISRLDSGCLDGTVIGRIDLEYVSGKKSKEVTV